MWLLSFLLEYWSQPQKPNLHIRCPYGFLNKLLGMLLFVLVCWAVTTNNRSLEHASTLNEVYSQACRFLSPSNSSVRITIASRVILWVSLTVGLYECGIACHYLAFNNPGVSKLFNNVFH